MMKLFQLVVAGFLVAGGVSQVRAEIALDFVGGQPATAAGGQTLGWEFSLSEEKTLTALGFWDEDSDGLAANHNVAIWTFDGQTQLSIVTITSASTPLASTSDGGRWLFELLVQPVVLGPGNYILGADYDTSTADEVRTAANSLSLASGVSFVQGRFTSPATAGFDFPNATFETSGGHFGPNAFFAEAAPVPEPASLTLVGMGLAGMACGALRRRRALKTTAAA